MAYDALVNFSYSTVITAPIPAETGTTLEINDEATMPAVPFNAVVWPTGAIPTKTNAEIVRVTKLTGKKVEIMERLTTTEVVPGIKRTILVGDQFAAVVTTKTIQDIITALSRCYVDLVEAGGKGDGKTVTDAKISASNKTLTTVAAAFEPSDVGKIVNVQGAFNLTNEWEGELTLNSEIVKGLSSGATNRMFIGDTLVHASIPAGTKIVSFNTGKSEMTMSAKATATTAKVKIKNVTPVPLATTIESYTSNKSVKVVTAAENTVTGAKLDWGTDNTAAWVAAFAKLPSYGGMVFVPPGNFLTPTTEGGEVGTIKLPANVQIVGTPGSTVVASVLNTFEGQLFFLKEGKVIFKDLRIVGITTKAINTAVLSGNAAVEMKFEGCFISNFGFAGRTWGGSTTILTATDTEVEGTGWATSSMGMHVPGGLGAQMIIDKCYFHHTGYTQDLFHNHCVYSYFPVAFRIANSTFNHARGRYIQTFGGPRDAPNAPEFCIIDSCVFGKDNEVGIQAVLTSPVTHTQITGCDFNTPAECIQIMGDCTITACSFEESVDTAHWDVVLFEEATESETLVRPARVKFTACKFKGSGLGGFETNEGSKAVVSFSNCEFTGNPTNCHIGMWGGFLEVDSCGFAGAPVGAAIALFKTSTAKVRNSRFENSMKTAIEANENTTLQIYNNDFSQKEGSVREGCKNLTAFGNYGSKGFKNEAYGVASVADGGTIAHGLPGTGAWTGAGTTTITPKGYGLTTTTATLIASVTAVGTANLTISLKVATTGAAEAVAKNVAWWAKM